MNQEGIDRITLAEAMDLPVWHAYISPGEHPEEINLPDPFTDANDDHAILEWALNKWHRKSKEMDLFCGALAEVAIWHDPGVGYRIGNNAKAVLAVQAELNADL